ncbi:hypothetical protein CAXC1_260039 [Candidatus Xenohaliotis californiensis]|uniref:Uncharacterized protein n=1 Tax=Candidatus Xenohaliotis californiensis TaxID=84677 RepID=A0ABM9N808_9RICK|nr:hypothetical protein CAXC1_260039 [Candidatus Xenohaliotis californiensis]
MIYFFRRLEHGSALGHSIVYLVKLLVNAIISAIHTARFVLFHISISNDYKHRYINILSALLIKVYCL